MTDIMKVGDTINASDKITSLELVEQINLFRKEEGDRAELQHKTLLEIIRDEFEDEIGQQKILPTLYKHPQNGQEYPMFELTLSQAKQVLVRESKFVRKAVIAYIDKLEGELKKYLPKTFAEALRLAAEQAEQIEQQQKQLELKDTIILEYEPKANYYDVILSSNNAINISVIAKDYGMSAKAMNHKLNELGVIFKSGDTWLPYQKYASQGYTKTSTVSYNDGKGATVHSKWTQKGRLFLYDLLKKNGILPLIEQ